LVKRALSTVGPRTGNIKCSSKLVDEKRRRKHKTEIKARAID